MSPALSDIRKAALRKEIIRVARKHLLKFGLDAVSLRAIAREVGYTAPALYSHFADKHSLIRAIVLEDFTSFRDSLSSAMTEPDPLKRLFSMGEKYIEFGLQHRDQYQFLFMTPTPAELDTDMGDNPGDEAFAMLLHTTAALRALGLLREELGDDMTISQIIWSGVHGLVSLQIVMEGENTSSWRDAKEIVAPLLRAIIHGVTIR